MQAVIIIINIGIKILIILLYTEINTQMLKDTRINNNNNNNNNDDNSKEHKEI